MKIFSDNLQKAKFNKPKKETKRFVLTILEAQQTQNQPLRKSQFF